jgi:membrane protein DedA with SNARE-associated domain
LISFYKDLFNCYQDYNFIESRNILQHCDADAELQFDCMIDYLINYLSRDLFSYLGVFVALSLTSVGFPVPEDIILLAGGFVAKNGFAKIELMIPITLISVLLGDMMMYWLGYKFGEKIYTWKPFCYVLTQARIDRVHKFYKHYGKFTIFVSRFAAGLRAWIYIFAGSSKMGFGRFILMDFLAALISVPLVVWLGFHFDDEIKQIAFFIGRVKLWALLLVCVIAIFIIVRNKIKKAHQPTENSTPKEQG